MTQQGSDGDVHKIADLIEHFPISMLSSLDGEGRIVAQPFAMQQQHHRFDGELWFLITVDSTTAKRLARDPRIGITLSKNDSWVSITGTAELSESQSHIDAMWDASVEAWFPDGRDDPGIRALIVHADGAEYWDTPGGTVATVISFVRSKTMGQPMQIDSDTVEL